MHKGLILYSLGRVLVLPLFLLAGCTNVHRPTTQTDLNDRLQDIHTVALSPAYIEGYLQTFNLEHTQRIPLPDSVITNFSTVIRDHFGQHGLRIQEIDMRDSVLAPATPPWNVSGYGPALIPRKGMNFKPKPFTNAPPDINADAAMFAFAWETTSTKGGTFRKTSPFTLIFMPLELGNDYVSGRPDSTFLNSVTKREVCMGLCMIDCRTGKVLWSDIETVYGSAKLEEPETAAKLVGKASRKFSKQLNLDP